MLHLDRTLGRRRHRRRRRRHHRRILFRSRILFRRRRRPINQVVRLPLFNAAITAVETVVMTIITAAAITAAIMTAAVGHWRRLHSTFHCVIIRRQHFIGLRGLPAELRGRHVGSVAGGARLGGVRRERRRIRERLLLDARGGERSV